MQTRLFVAAAVGLALCAVPTPAAITIYKSDNSIAHPNEAQIAWNGVTGGYLIELKTLYAPGGWTSYDIHVDGGETIDWIKIAVPCWTVGSGCVPAGSPVVVRVFSDPPLGVSTIHMVFQTTEAEVIVSQLEAEGDIGSVIVESIGIVDAGRDVIGPVIATTPDNPNRGINRVSAGRHVLGDVLAENGYVGVVSSATGNIGMPDDPIDIRSRYKLSSLVCEQGTINANIISDSAHTNIGFINGALINEMHGNLETGHITAGGGWNEGFIEIVNAWSGTISIGSGLVSTPQNPKTIRLPGGGLTGQIILNAYNLPGQTWSAPITLGENTFASAQINGPGYTHTAESLGGGSVGLVPFQLHDESCAPVNGANVVLEAGDPFPTVKLRHYGPITWNGLPVEVARRSAGSSDPFVTMSPTNFAAQAVAGDTNSVRIVAGPSARGFEPGYEYRIRAGKQLKCATPGAPAVAWDRDYLFTVTQNAQQLCSADVNDDLSVDVFDLLTVLAFWGPVSTPNSADINADNSIDVFDLLAVLDAWGSCP